MVDYLGKDGCCLICDEAGECDRPCFECQCRKCDWYILRGGKCQYPLLKRERIFIEGIEILRETEKGVLLHVKEHGESWFPRSQITVRKHEISIPRWLLEEKGWMWPGDWDVLDGLSFKEFKKKRLSRSFSPDPYRRVEGGS